MTSMTRLISLAAILAFAIMALAQTPQTGAKGGCYIVTTSKKTGKTYKRYVSKDLCRR